MVDEASMLDVNLAGALFHALPPTCSILMVGDDDQLPSVGPGAVLHDLLRCPRVPRVELETLFRQSADGDIARNARQILRGAMPTHLTHFDSSGALMRAIASTQVHPSNAAAAQQQHLLSAPLTSTLSPFPPLPHHPPPCSR